MMFKSKERKKRERIVCVSLLDFVEVHLIWSFGEQSANELPKATMGIRPTI